MPDDFAEFKNCLPLFHRCITIDHETEEALHVARWADSAFDSFAAFVGFTFRFSSIIQPYIFDPQRDDLESWFHADPLFDQRAAETISKNQPVNQEAKEWMDQNYPTITIDWLISGMHGKLISLTDGDWPEMFGYDTQGYFSAFVADAT